MTPIIAYLTKTFLYENLIILKMLYACDLSSDANEKV